MKKFLLFSLILSASAMSGQDIYDKMAKESCSCITAKYPTAASMPQENISDAFVTCFIQIFAANSDQLNTVHSVDINDETQMDGVSEKVAMKMLAHCPDYLMALGRATEAASEVSYSMLQGKVTEIKSGDFLTLIIKDDESRSHQFLLLEFFESASLLTKNKLKKNDVVAVTFSKYEMYDPRLKEFRSYNVLSDIELK